MRILSFIFILLSFLSLGVSTSYFAYSAGSCDPTDMGSAATFLKNCGSGTDGYKPLGGGVTATKTYAISIATKVIQFGALFAIGAIVFSGVQYTMSYGDDEKIKKAKMTGIYAVGGLLLLLTAFPLVDILVNFIYDL